MEEQRTGSQTLADPSSIESEERALPIEEEIAELEKLLSEEPDDFQARCRLGELYFNKGRLDEALAEVKKSIEMAEGLRIEMDRSLAMYYSNLGTIYGTKSMTEEATAQFQRALELNRYDVLALFNIARLHGGFLSGNGRSYLELLPAPARPSRAALLGAVGGVRCLGRRSPVDGLARVGSDLGRPTCVPGRASGRATIR